MIEPSDRRFDGLIAGASFSSGDTIVVGCWPSSPFGPFVDAMWARPDGTRTLVVDRGPQADFIWSHYAFEERIVAPTGARVQRGSLVATCGPLRLAMSLRPAGLLSWLLRVRPAFLERAAAWSMVEDAACRVLAGPLLGARVRTSGVTRAGARERYVARDVRWASQVTASVDGADLGSAAAPRAVAGFRLQ